MDHQSFLSSAAQRFQESAIRKSGALAGRVPDLISFAPGYPASELFPWDELKAIAGRFRVGRVSLMPTFEVFNINNSDAIISYITTNVLSTSYLAPNSIMQGRMYGLGVVTRW